MKVMSSGELRNSFNRIMRSLYLIEDDSGSGYFGRHGYLDVKKSSYINAYIEMCYDIISDYEKEEKVSEEDITSFIDEFERTTSHYLSNNIKETTRVKSKKIIKEYLNEIKSNYDNSEIKKLIDNSISNIEEYERISLYQKKDKTKKRPNAGKKEPKNDEGESEEEGNRPEILIVGIILLIIIVLYLLLVYFNLI